MALTYSIPSVWLVGEEHQQGRKRSFLIFTIKSFYFCVMALTYSIPSVWLVGEEHQQGRNKKFLFLCYGFDLQYSFSLACW
ncbi:MAG: hypothetical protein NW207_06540 [Cytophagales bacterium]|nr:hypothetical protein [Cytophagales bacterium]